ncbi:hypothetical protein [Pontibacter sp. G13]|uniref:YncE family protein n=1 Tax=Pontibacter sp. G13 TaxID=3074898 RepID=UPI00288C5BA6|nr:hypothetical protein [Pontibacter sp. G13]WNJ16299.1 hypothetical protein RJD25_15655 [Pontibacter sp. G13]
MNQTLSRLMTIGLLFSLMACGGSPEQSEAQADNAPAPEKSTRSMKLENIGLASPESVISDGTHYYISNMGKELAPSEKDGDGFIMKLDFEGNVVTEAFIAGLDAPKGMAIAGGKLYVTDIDKVKIFTLADGQPAGEIDFSSSGTAFLNDLAMQNEKTLFLSATDINRIYKISTADNSFEEIETAPNVQKPNGLWWDELNRRLLVASFMGSEPNGVVGEIKFEVKGNSYKELNPFQGALDGLALAGDLVIFSDWNRQAVLILNQATGQVGMFPLPSKTINGPADFFYDQARGELWIPGMQENTLTVQAI